MNFVDSIPVDAKPSKRPFARAACVRSIKLVIALGATLLPLPATAGWTTNGVAVAPSDSAQIEVAMVPDGVGGAVIAWEGQLGTNYTTELIRLTPGGDAMPGWPMLEAQSASPSDVQFNDMMLAPDGDGGVYVANDQNLDLRLRRVLGDGTLAAGWGAGIKLQLSQSAPPASRRERHPGK